MIRFVYFYVFDDQNTIMKCVLYSLYWHEFVVSLLVTVDIYKQILLLRIPMLCETKANQFVEPILVNTIPSFNL